MGGNKTDFLIKSEEDGQTLGPKFQCSKSCYRRGGSSALRRRQILIRSTADFGQLLPGRRVIDQNSFLLGNEAERFYAGTFIYIMMPRTKSRCWQNSSGPHLCLIKNEANKKYALASVPKRVCLHALLLLLLRDGIIQFAGID